MSLASDRFGEVHDDLEVTLDEIIGVLSKDEHAEFILVLQEMQNILDEPGSMVGSQALVSAAKIAALRTKIGLRAQWYKTSEKSDIQRRRKDLLMSLYASLEENINTLKLLGRIEGSMIR